MFMHIDVLLHLINYCYNNMFMLTLFIYMLLTIGTIKYCYNNMFIPSAFTLVNIIHSVAIIVKIHRAPLFTPLVYVAIITVIITCLCYCYNNMFMLDYVNMAQSPTYCYNNMFMLIL